MKSTDTPTKRGRPPMAFVGVTLPQAQAQALKDAAWAQRTSVSALLRTAADAVLAQAQEAHDGS